MAIHSWAFLGPEGTNSEQAARSLQQRFDQQCELIAYGSIYEAMMAVENKVVSHCVVPVENSTEGSVRITLDTLANSSLIINAEISWKIQHELLISESNQDIHTVISHAQALSQCRQYLNKYYPQARTEAVSSTARAAQKVRELGSGYAAIASTAAASLYHLDILASSIQDIDNNCTRFLLLSRPENVYVNPDITSMMLICALNGRVGSLYELLGDFAKNQVNMTRIESRPMRDGKGEYMFFIDIELGDEPKAVQRALLEARNHCSWLKEVGKY